MSRLKAALTLAGVLAILLMWGAAAMNYDDSVAVGRYHFRGVDESCQLVLRDDHIFEQSLVRNGRVQQARGTWRRVGEGGVSFSREFLAVRGEEPDPDGSTFADVHKSLGLFPSLQVRQYFVIWYGKTSTDSALEGTYAEDEPGITSSIVLGSDGIFQQTVTANQVKHQARGTWTQAPDGGVQFSREFLRDDGQHLDVDEQASSMDRRAAYLQIEITKANRVQEPVFHKSLFQ